MKKKMLPAALGVVLALAVVWTMVFADTMTGFTSTNPVDTVPGTSNWLGSGREWTVGERIVVALQKDAFGWAPGGAPNLVALTATGARVQGRYEFDALFDVRFELNTDPATMTAKPVLLVLVPKAVGSAEDVPFTYNITLHYQDAAVATPTNARSTAFTLSGTIRADQVPYTVSGFSTAVPPQTARTLYAGADESYIGLRTSIFTYTGNHGAVPEDVTAADLAQYGLRAYSTNSLLSAALEFNGSWVVLRMSVPENTPAGTYDTQLRIYSADGAPAKLPGEHIFADLRVTVPGNSLEGGLITGIDPNARLGYTANGIWGQAAHNGSLLGGYGAGSLSGLDLRSGDEITLQFDSDFFLWQDGKPDPAVRALAQPVLRRGKITARALTGLNSNLVDTVDIRHTPSSTYVRVKFVNRFASTKERDFRVTVGLAYDGRTVSGTEVLLSGTISNAAIEVYSGDTYIDLSDGQVIEAMETISRTEIDLGFGVSVHTRLNRGKLYYGSVTMEPDNRDLAMMELYPSIESVYNLSTVGINTRGTTVRLDTNGRYFVYNRNLEFLGMSSERLPYHTKYYLSTRKLELPDEEKRPARNDYQVVVQPAGETPGAAGDTNPAYYPVNENFNPVTGR